MINILNEKQMKSVAKIKYTGICIELVKIYYMLKFNLASLNSLINIIEKIDHLLDDPISYFPDLKFVWLFIFSYILPLNYFLFFIFSSIVFGCFIKMKQLVYVLLNQVILFGLKIA